MRRWLPAALALVAMTACSSNDRQGPATVPPATFTSVSLAPATPTPAAIRTEPATTATVTPAATATIEHPPSPPPRATPTATPAVAASPAPPPVAGEPRGFPLDPEQHTGLVVGAGASRRVVWDAGRPVAAFSREDQPSADPERANRGGWNCRTHQEYEARPAVDWYIPTGTPIRATMDGTATLYVITVANAFDHYGIDRRPYLGNPDRARAPLSPFPGPGGGKGVFVQIMGGRFVTEYAHLELGATVALLPASGFLPGFSATTDYSARFAAMRDAQATTAIARWPVRRGEVIGISGDSGYSEAPHLHYTVSRAGGPLLCPTTEAGFADSGWLFR